MGGESVVHLRKQRSRAGMVKVLIAAALDVKRVERNGRPNQRAVELARLLLAVLTKKQERTSDKVERAFGI